MMVNSEKLSERIDEWKEKVMNSATVGGMVDTYSMVSDIDRILSEEFSHDPVITI